MLARLALHVFFRHIEVEGRSRIPAAGPVLFVPNHANALVDPLFLVITLRRRVTVTAKNVLSRNPLLGALIRGLGVITFHRREDAGKGADLRQNVQSLRRCRAVLAEGGALCIFPEGISHSDPSLRPFKTGPARIALDFVRDDGNPGRLQMVPVGLLYTEKDQFRSDVWLRYGEPLDVGDWLERHPDGDARALTDEIARRVHELTLNYEDRKEALLLTWAAEVVATGGAMPAPLGRDERPVAEWFRLVARLQAGYRTLRDQYPDEVAALTSRIRHYRQELKRRGLDPAEVFLPLHLGRALLFLVRELELLVVGLPLMAFGALNHLVPYLIVRRIARALSTDRDHWASNVVYPGFVVLPLFYLLQLGAAWLLLPWSWAAVYTVALPYTGYYALLYQERAGSALQRTRTFFQFLRDRSLQERLSAEGRAIVGQVRDLAARLPAESRAPTAAVTPTTAALPHS